VSERKSAELSKPPSPLLVAALEAIGQFVRRQGCPELAAECIASLQPAQLPRTHQQTLHYDATTSEMNVADHPWEKPSWGISSHHVLPDPTEEIICLARELFSLSKVQCSPLAGDSMRSTLVRPTSSFIWSLLPPFLEKPWNVAAIAHVSRASAQALNIGGHLCLGHLNCHPNSLCLPSVHGGFAVGDPCADGSLARIALGSLVSVHFHIPRVGDVLWLLEGLAHSTCHSLRRIVDRQSRWRPREQRFDSLDAAILKRAADLVDAFGSPSFPCLRHIEGPIFSWLLRAQSHRLLAAESEAAAAAAGSEVSASSGAPLEVAVGCPSCASGLSTLSGDLGAKLEVLFLVDAIPSDLLGLAGLVYSRLRRLVLLNLPAAGPGQSILAVTELVGKAPNLTELQMDFQYFDPASWQLESMELLVERVQCPPSKVSKLVLDWCRLGNAGVQSVCRAFARHPAGSVTELALSHNDLRDVGCVCDMLETPSLSIVKLDLSSNAFDDIQAMRIAEALPFSKVKTLRLRDSQVSSPFPVKTEWFWGC